MSFQDTSFSREHRYSLGIETESDRHDLSIPVSNSLVDDEELCEITASDHERWNRGTPA